MSELRNSKNWNEKKGEEGIPDEEDGYGAIDERIGKKIIIGFRLTTNAGFS
ncbi:hypothetical protein BVRB_6g135350 [Beta vulgaris subsp. vulgaris]|nr:hypothetical protein BVRB_6g135350 [Beta vulgaris subsp. vulgaris]